ncbi:MAG: hypothetical protein H6Q92_2024 [Nitrospirae bacterium]|nr:hypothetical protein [Nitrospirota bacterium]
MSCIEFLAAQSRCKRGIPVARLFRHYFCEGNHKVCPIKETEKTAKRIDHGKGDVLFACFTKDQGGDSI